MKYVAEVTTGSKAGAGTDANVFLNVFSQLLGDTGDRSLESSSTNMNKFERGRVSCHNVLFINYKTSDCQILLCLQKVRQMFLYMLILL